MNLDLSRFKNYGLWVSLLALIPLILSCFGINLVPEEYEQIINLVLSILLALGVINNPTTESRWYKDDKYVDKK